MIDIKEALYNILHSRYGRDVRQSIHDGIYQINENANEAVQTAKAMGVGTDISSPTSSSTGYVAGNLYLNNSTWDLWQCIGTDSWVNKGNIKGETGVKGADGINYYIHIRYSDKYDGTGFTASPTASSEYMGVYYGTSQTAPTNKQDYQWTSYVGASGTSAYVHIMYSENADGTGFVSIPTPLCKYIGFYSGPLSSPPANKSYYTWSEYVGKSGTGSGDMTAAEYAPSGVYGKVDNAIKADNVGNADTSLLEKLSDNSGSLNYNGNALMLEAAQFANQAKLGEFVVNQISNNVKELALHSNITTKLPKSVPTTSDAGKVATVQSDGTVDWETPSASITEPTDLEKGIIGGDAWTAKSYTAGSTVIYNNKIYSCIADCGASNLPTDTTYWEETSLSALNSKKINKPASATENQVLTFKNNEWVADSKAPKLLWENPSPSATFSAKLITLNSSDFDFYVIYYIYDNSHLNWLGSMWGIAGLGIMTFMNDSSGNRFQRNYIRNSDTTLNVNDCKMNGSIKNEYMIPYKIYGYKY